MQRIWLSLLLATALFLISSTSNHVMALDPRFEIDPQILRKNLPAPVPVTLPKQQVTVKKRGRPAGDRVYIVRQGDSLMKILRGHFGLSRREAVKLLPLIVEQNRLKNPSSLEVGQRLIIPPSSARIGGFAVKAGGKEAKTFGVISHSLSLINGRRGSFADMVSDARHLWQRLMPGHVRTDLPYSIHNATFSLELDPRRFPVFPAADDGKIIVEAGGKLSPLVRNLITQREVDVRFVSADSADRRAFLADLLSAAGFFSVEEDFSVSFGKDPRLTVRADFKVENDSDSPLGNDIFLVNSGSRYASYPERLNEFLAGQGFTVVDLGQKNDASSRGTGTVRVLQGGEPLGAVDDILTSLGLHFDRGKEIELFSIADDGVGLKVMAERYFSSKGIRHVVSMFNGNPEHYTLLRLLESMGYRVIIIEPEQGVRKAAEKLLAMLEIKGDYTMQPIIDSRSMPFEIEMSGIMVSSKKGEGRLFLTLVQPDPVIKDLLKLNGIRVEDGGGAR